MSYHLESFIEKKASTCTTISTLTFLTQESSFLICWSFDWGKSKLYLPWQNIQDEPLLLINTSSMYFKLFSMPSLTVLFLFIECDKLLSTLSDLMMSRFCFSFYLISIIVGKVSGGVWFVNLFFYVFKESCYQQELSKLFVQFEI